MADIRARLLFVFGAFALMGIVMFAWSALAAEEEPGDDNPYIPRKEMSAEDLRAYIEVKLEVPVSIRVRPQYAEGMAIAAERLLETNPTGTARTFALVNLLDFLHLSADLHQDEAADEKLAALAEKLATDSDKKVAAAAAYLVLEQRVLNSDDLEPAALPKLLDEVHTALAGKELATKHLRMASGTTHVINRLSDDEDATKRLKQFGELFAKSKEPELARYGGKLLKVADKNVEENKWLGKPAEIAGTTTDGAKFDIAQYKGKVVLIDFWATWCGPCRAALPTLKATYEEFHKQGFEVVAISLDEDLEALGTFIDAEKIRWVNIVGEQQGDEMKFPLAKKYSIEAIPAVLLVDKAGNIVARDLHGDELVDAIEALLAGKPVPGQMK